jgi:hypothetical protein
VLPNLLRLIRTPFLAVASQGRSGQLLHFFNIIIIIIIIFFFFFVLFCLFFLGLEAPAIYLHSIHDFSCGVCKFFCFFPSLSHLLLGFESVFFVELEKNRKIFAFKRKNVYRSWKSFFFLFLNKIGVECCTSLLQQGEGMLTECNP